MLQVHGAKVEDLLVKGLEVLEMGKAAHGPGLAKPDLKASRPSGREAQVVDLQLGSIIEES